LLFDLESLLDNRQKELDDMPVKLPDKEIDEIGRKVK